MRRTLSITVDDEAQATELTGLEQFSLAETLGLGEYVRIWARRCAMKRFDNADTVDAPEPRKPKRSRKSATKKGK